MINMMLEKNSVKCHSQQMFQQTTTNIKNDNKDIQLEIGKNKSLRLHYNFMKFHQNQMKNKKAHFSVQNFKVSVEL